MDERIRDAFASIHAEEELKKSTRAVLEQARTRRHRPARALTAAVACLVLLVVGIGGYQFYFTPTPVLSIDINPSLELGVNRFDKVVSVQSYNEDGQALADILELKYLDYRDALEELLASPDMPTGWPRGPCCPSWWRGRTRPSAAACWRERRHVPPGRRMSAAATVTRRSWSRPTMRGCPWASMRPFWSFRPWSPPSPPTMWRG